MSPDLKKTFNLISFILYFAFNVIFIAIFCIILFSVNSEIETDAVIYITGISTIAIALFTGSFFLIRVYIENQLGIKEKEMLKEYQDALDKQTEKQNKKFTKIEETQNERFSKIEETQKKIINSVYEALRKIEENFEKNEENFKKINENIKKN